VPSIHYVQQQPRNGDRLRCAGAHATVAGVGVKPLYHLICIAVPVEKVTPSARRIGREDAEDPLSAA